MSISANTAFIKSLSRELEFTYCGISKAEFLAEEAPRLEEWLKRGYHGTMSYLENHFDKRLEPYPARARCKIRCQSAVQLLP